MTWVGNRIDKTRWGTTERRVRLRRLLLGNLARRPGVVDQFAGLMHLCAARRHHDMSDAYGEEVIQARIRQYLYIFSAPLLCGTHFGTGQPVSSVTLYPANEAATL